MREPVVLYGVPGVGKSTLAARLAAQAGVVHVELDELRPQLRASEPTLVLDFTTDAWRRLGALTPESAVAGLRAVRSAFASHVARVLSERAGGGFVAESAVVDPTVALACGAVPRLVVLRDRDAHYARFFVHRVRGPAADEQFRAARLIQRHLVDEAATLGVAVLDSGGVPAGGLER